MYCRCITLMQNIYYARQNLTFINSDYFEDSFIFIIYLYIYVYFYITYNGYNKFFAKISFIYKKFLYALLINSSFSVLVRNKTLETLNISGCELGPEDGIALAEVLSSGCVELEALSLDVSNNNFGFTGINNKELSYIKSICFCS